MFWARRSVGAVALATTCAAVLFAPAADAVRFNFVVYENADSADLSGFDVWVDVVDSGSFADFTFFNDSTEPANVANVYFEAAGAGLGLSNGAIHAESAGVDFRIGSSPSNPAPGNSLVLDWAGTLQSFGARPAPAHNGVGHLGNEFLTVRWDLQSSSFDDIINGMSDGTFRISQHVTGVGDDELSVWTGTPGDPVPLPASIWLLASGLAFTTGGRLFRRRK